MSEREVNPKEIRFASSGLCGGASREFPMRGISKLYTCECEIEGCETNASLVNYFLALDNGDQTPATVDCSENYIGAKGCLVLSRMLQAMRWVQHLSIRAVGISEAGIASLCKVAAEHPSLQTIDMRGNCVFASSARQLATAAKKNKQLWRIMIDKDEVPTRILRELSTALAGNVAQRLAIEAGRFRVVTEDQTPPLTPQVEDSRKLAPSLMAVLDGNISAYVSAYDKHSRIVPHFVIEYGVRELPALLDYVRPVSFTDAVLMLRKLPEGLVAELAEARSNDLIAAQVDRLLSCVGDASGEQPAAPDPALLRHVVHTLSGRSLGDITLFAHVESELQQLLASIKHAYTEKRTLLLLSDQCKYFLVRHRSSTWMAGYGNKLPSLRVDGTAAVEALEQLLQQVEVQERHELATNLQAVLPAAVMQWLACEQCAGRGGVGSLGLIGLVASVRSEKQWVDLFFEEFAPWYRLRAILGRSGLVLLQY